MTETPFIRPLFTTTPLSPPIIPSAISPTDKRFNIARPATSDHSKETDHPDNLRFDKIAIPRRTAGQAYSPKVPLDRLSCSSVPSDDIRTPSLISYLFQAGRSRHSSSSGSSHHTPLTPLSTSPAQGYRPILRRPTASSTSTSASEDNGVRKSDLGGMGFTSMDKVPVAAGRERKECTIKFVVEPFRTASTGTLSQAACSNRKSSDSRHGTGSSARYSQFRAPRWNATEATGFPSDDEGYQEDEEGGFTSDEELFETRAESSRTSRTCTSRVPFSAPADGACEVDSGESSSQEAFPLTLRGRKVRIAVKTKQRSSRHRSPPHRPFPTDLPLPAARSPSGALLLQRRQARQGQSTA